MRSPDVDVTVAFVNPVTFVPMDEHNLQCRTFTKTLFRFYLCQLPFNIFTLYYQSSISLLSASIISINTQVTLKTYLPDISMKMSPFGCIMSNSVSDCNDLIQSVSRAQHNQKLTCCSIEVQSAVQTH